jgi:hypothetical protein
MKHRVVTIGVCLCLAAAFAATTRVAGQESRPHEERKTEGVSLTGCLVQGSGPNVFIFENAKTDPTDSSEMGRSYVLTTAMTSISFRDHLNHEVRIDGSAETRVPPDPPMGQKVNESDLPKLTATKLTPVATTCSQTPN